MRNTYVIIDWDQAPKWGEKRKKSASEANRGVWGGMRMTELRRLPLLPSPPLGSVRKPIFPLFLSIFAFSPHYGAWSQANVTMVLQ